jgi:DNA-binding CsgD family transcriptional regulator
VAFSTHARALISGDGEGLLVAADHFEAIGALVHAAEAAAEASIAMRDAAKPARATAAATRAAALVARCPGVRTPVLDRATGPPNLTRREHEVALLAGRGLSSSQIAARLVVSRRTVEGHLARAYQKLGVRRRSELVAVLTPHSGQLPPTQPRR